jgi:hypothetical protein
MANHTDFMFPTDKLLDDGSSEVVLKPFDNSNIAVGYDCSSSSIESSCTPDEVVESTDATIDDFVYYAGALTCLESVFVEKLKE